MNKQQGMRRGAVIFSMLAVLMSMTAWPHHVAIADPSKTPVVADIPADSVGAAIAFVRAHPTQYSGIYLDPAANRYVIGVPAGQDASAALNKVTSNVGSTGKSSQSVTLTSVYQKRSLAELTEIENQVAANTGEFGKAAGDEVSQWGLDEEHNTVQVGVLHLNDDLVASARRTYGDSVELRKVDRHYIAVRDVPLASVGKEAPSDRSYGILSRQLDMQPYWAGNEIGWVHDNRIGLCTSGWISGVTRGQRTSLEFMYSAGHCFPQGAIIQQGHCEMVNGGCRWTTTGDVGVVNAVEWGDNRMDWESISPLTPNTIEQNVYVGGPTSSTGIAEYNMNGVALHQRVCSEGAFTGQNCTGEITAINGCIRLSDDAGRITLVCQQDFASSTNGTRMVQHGDSGGPVLGFEASSGDGNGFGHGVISGGNVGTPTNPGPGTQFNFSDGAQICNLTPCF